MRAGALALAALLLVAGCARALRFDAPGLYTVRSGDTLYSIAFRHGLDYRELARLNAIRPPYRLRPGDVLRLSGSAAAAAPAPASAPSTPAAPRRAPVAPAATLRWAWPAPGELIAEYRAGSANAKGIDVAGGRGDAIVSAADGRVVYAGSGLVGYGKVIIVKHDDRWLSAYAHLDEFHAREGEQVQRGQRIASMGLGPGQRPMLHFEIRLDGNPVDPLPLLPRR
jgi:lipoprotein NlpD